MDANRLQDFSDDLGPIRRVGGFRKNFGFNPNGPSRSAKRSYMPYNSNGNNSKKQLDRNKMIVKDSDRSSSSSRGLEPSIAFNSFGASTSILRQRKEEIIRLHIPAKLAHNYDHLVPPKEKPIKRSRDEVLKSERENIKKSISQQKSWGYAARALDRAFTPREKISGPKIPELNDDDDEVPRHLTEDGISTIQGNRKNHSKEFLKTFFQKAQELEDQGEDKAPSK